MKKPRFETEKDLAKAAVQWLSEERWEVYQEVKHGARVCDLVARRGPVVWAIECKLALNLEVLAQASYWRWRANYISVCVPRGKATYAVEALFSELGIGLLEANPFDDKLNARLTNRPGRMCRPKRPAMIDNLHEEQKTYCEAGGNRGGYYTPFKATCREVTRAVMERPGLTLKELMTTITHHYSSDASARGCIAKWAEEGGIEGVELRREGKVLTLWPKGFSAPVTVGSGLNSNGAVKQGELAGLT